MERLKVLKRTILRIIKHPPKELIYVYYLFYDQDNPKIVQNIKYELIYN